MNFIDRRLSDLYAYHPQLTKPENFEAFWNETLDIAGKKPLNDRRVLVDQVGPYMEAFHVTYEGYDETPIHGWFARPTFKEARDKGPLPCIVHFHGYSGSKGYPGDYAFWQMMGYAVFTVDVRGQNGETGNLLPQSLGMSKGWISQGLLDPAQSYYRAISVDAWKAVEWASQQPEIDQNRIIVCGGSQGGGLALMCAALSEKPAIAIADIPNMCHMDYGIYHSTGSLTEAAAFVQARPETLETVLNTLSYFDLLHFTDRITCPVLMSASLKDTVCSPETIFSVYNRIQSTKELVVFPFNGHQITGDHNTKRLSFIQNHLK